MLSRQESTLRAVPGTKLGLGSAHCVILYEPLLLFHQRQQLRIGGGWGGFVRSYEKVKCEMEEVGIWRSEWDSIIHERECRVLCTVDMEELIDTYLMEAGQTTILGNSNSTTLGTCTLILGNTNTNTTY